MRVPGFIIDLFLPVQLARLAAEEAALRAEGAAAERARVEAHLRLRAERIGLIGGEGARPVGRAMAVLADDIAAGLHIVDVVDAGAAS